MSKYYLKCKKIGTSVERAKNMLVKRAEKNGLYENFGQDECDKIGDKFIDISKYTDEMNIRRTQLQNFRDWCMNFSL